MGGREKLFFLESGPASGPYLLVNLEAQSMYDYLTLPYVMVAVLIVYPRAWRAAFRWLRPIGNHTGWMYSDWFMRTVGVLLLLVFLALESLTRRP